MKDIKLWSFILIIIFAGYYDFKYKIIPNYIPIIILLIALLPNFNLFRSMVGFFFISLPFIIPIYFDYNSIGGGDIKYMASIGFFLGIEKALLALILGLTIAVAFNLIILRKKGNEVFPLAPYIGIGILMII